MSLLRQIIGWNRSSKFTSESVCVDHHEKEIESSMLGGEQHDHFVSFELGDICLNVSAQENTGLISDFHNSTESDDAGATLSPASLDKASSTSIVRENSEVYLAQTDLGEEDKRLYDSGFSTENEDSEAVSIASDEGNESDINEQELLESVMRSLNTGSCVEPRFSLDQFVDISLVNEPVSESSRLFDHRPRSYNGIASSNYAFVETFNYMEPIHVLAQDLLFPGRSLPSIGGVKPNAGKGIMCENIYTELDGLVIRRRKIPEILMSWKICGVKSVSLRDPIWLEGCDLPISARQMRVLIVHGKINEYTKKRYNYTDIQSTETYSLEQQKKVKFYSKGFRLLDKEMFEQLDYHLNQPLPLKLISSDFNGVKGRPLREPVFIKGIKKPLARTQTERILRRHVPTKSFTQNDIIPYDELDEKQLSEIEFLKLGFQYLDKNMRMELDKHVGIKIPPELMSSFPHDKYSLKERYFIKRSSTPVSKKYFEEVIAKPNAAYSDRTPVSREDIAKPAMYTQSQKSTCEFLDTGFTLLEEKKRDDLYQLIKRRNSKQLLLQKRKELRSSAVTVTS
ncbi:MAG: hypothetical protein HAW66_09545 [Shewanella sp.]|nr:hypothetical protein [Shewanella sp.]